MRVGVDHKQDNAQNCSWRLTEVDRETTEIYCGSWHTLRLGQPNQHISASTNDILVEAMGVGMGASKPQLEVISTKNAWTLFHKKKKEKEMYK